MDVAHTALLLIDIQNDFCHTNGVAGLNGKSMAMMDDMLTHSSRLLQAARKAGVLVVHVQHTVLPIGGSDAPAWRYFLSPLSPDGAIVVHGTWGHGLNWILTKLATNAHSIKPRTCKQKDRVASFTRQQHC